VGDKSSNCMTLPPVAGDLTGLVGMSATLCILIQFAFHRILSFFVFVF